MRGANIRMSADTLIDPLSLYTKFRLASHPTTQELYAKWVTEESALVAANESWKEALRAELRARAQRDWEEKVLRNEIRAFSNRAAEIGNGSRRSAIFRTYFPDGLSAVPFTGLGDLIAIGRSLILLLEQETNESLTQAGQSLGTVIDAAQIVEDEWQEARAVVRLQRDALEAAKIAWIGAYRAVEGALIVLHPHDRELVSSFFYKKARRTRSGGTDEPVVDGEVDVDVTVNGGVTSNGGVAVAGSVTSNGGAVANGGVTSNGGAVTNDDVTSNGPVTTEPGDAGIVGMDGVSAAGD